MEPFTFQRCQPADEPWLICTLQHQIRGILVLARALGAGYLSILENVDSLPAEHGMVIGGSQRIGNAFLIANAISAVLRLPVNSIAGDAEYSFLLRWWCIVPSREFKSKRWRIVRTGIFIYNKRLVISAHAECCLLYTSAAEKKRGRKITQKEFVIGLIEQALAEYEAQNQPIAMTEE